MNISEIKEALEEKNLVRGVAVVPSAAKDDWLRYLIGEVERLEKEANDFKQAFGEARKLIEHWNEQYEDCKKELARTERYYCGQVEELQKALEDQKLRMQDGHKNGYESETIFWTRCIWEIDQALQSIQGGKEE